jgi:lipopolysaccharide export system protein LptA
LLLILHATAAFAERADRSKPIVVEADAMSADDQKQVTTWERNVIVTQGTMQIRAEKVIVQQFPDGTQNATAWGKPVSFRQKREGMDEYVEGFGERLEYRGKDEQVSFFNQARVRRGQDELRGNFISYNAHTEFFEAKGSEAGRGGRVRGVFQPSSKDSGTPAKSAETLPLQPSRTLTPSSD